jgi:hypothetical protein
MLAISKACARTGFFAGELTRVTLLGGFAGTGLRSVAHATVAVPTRSEAVSKRPIVPLIFMFTCHS